VMSRRRERVRVGTGDKGRVVGGSFASDSPNLGVSFAQGGHSPSPDHLRKQGDLLGPHSDMRFSGTTVHNDWASAAVGRARTHPLPPSRTPESR
jgi:hypothetical protein